MKIRYIYKLVIFLDYCFILVIYRHIVMTYMYSIESFINEIAFSILIT